MPEEKNGFQEGEIPNVSDTNQSTIRAGEAQRGNGRVGGCAASFAFRGVVKGQNSGETRPDGSGSKYLSFGLKIGEASVRRFSDLYLTSLGGRNETVSLDLKD